MDEGYLLAAIRYVKLNPVRAKVVKRPWEYLWSSTQAHIKGVDDQFVNVAPLLRMVKDWKEFLLSGINEKEIEELRKHERTGRPLGSERFIKKFERTLDRLLHKQKPGREKRNEQN